MTAIGSHPKSAAANVASKINIGIIIKNFLLVICAVTGIMAANQVMAAYPSQSGLTFEALPFKNVAITNVNIQNGSFVGAPLPAVLPAGEWVNYISKMNNDDYSLSFTLNNLPLGNCDLVFYTPLGTEKHPLFTEAGVGCLDIQIGVDYANPGFYISMNDKKSLNAK